MNRGLGDQVGRAAIATRIFVVATVLTLTVTLGSPLIPGPIAVAFLAVFASLVAGQGRALVVPTAAAEGFAVALIAQFSAPHMETTLVYLAVPPLIAGIGDRRRGCLIATGAEIMGVLLGATLIHDRITTQLITLDLLWLTAGLGLGLAGRRLYEVLNTSAKPEPYRDAVSLIRQLQQLTEGLTGGLDMVSLSDSVLFDAAEDLPLRNAGLFLVTDGTLSPLRLSPGSDPHDVTRFARVVEGELALLGPTTVKIGTWFAIPLIYDGELIAMLIADCSPAASEAQLDLLAGQLQGAAIRLHAAALFSMVRAAAATDERQRLAREVHDGIAQDVASLGYLVDAIEPTSPDQGEQLLSLRSEVTRVVSELRRSVFDLRNEVDEGRRLSDSLQALGAHIGSRSPISVHVDVVEATERLPREIENHLLRIAQEAMNNARKHSGARNLWISGRIAPRVTTLEVTDDGTGFGRRAGDDSNGLKIMRERADMIGASLEVTSGPDAHGTTVRVSLSAPALAAPR